MVGSYWVCHWKKTFWVGGCDGIGGRAYLLCCAAYWSGQPRVFRRLSRSCSLVVDWEVASFAESDQGFPLGTPKFDHYRLHLAWSHLEFYMGDLVLLEGHLLPFGPLGWRILSWYGQLHLSVSRLRWRFHKSSLTQNKSIFLLICIKMSVILTHCGLVTWYSHKNQVNWVNIGSGHQDWCGGHFLLSGWHAVLWFGLRQCHCWQMLCGLGKVQETTACPHLQAPVS